MTTAEPSDDAVLDSLEEGGEYDPDDGIALEAAFEAINGAVGAYNGRIAAERSGAQPDPAALARWDAGIDACIRARDGLRLDDQAGIAEARRRYSALILDIREGRA